MGHTREELAARRRRLHRRRRVRAVALLLAAGAAAAGLAFALSGLGGASAPEPARAEPEPPPTSSGWLIEQTPLPEPEPEPDPAEPAPPPAVIRIAAVGDVAMGRTSVLPSDGAAGLFRRVKRELRGDVVLGNLEQALTDTGTSKCAPPPPKPRKKKRRQEQEEKPQECFAFRTPPAYAARLADAGFTVLNLANNHSSDYGQAGLDETVAALRAERLRHTGRPGQIARVRAKGVRVAVLGFAPYATAQNMLDIPAARRLVRRAARRADLVVVTMHAGAEGAGAVRVPRGPESYLGEPRGDPRRFAHAVIEAGADLVVGHGPHVLRGLEWYRGRLIAYSLGNFAGYRTLNTAGAGGAGAILRVALHADGTWKGGRLVPVRLDTAGTPAPDRSRETPAAVRRLSREDFGRRAVRVARDGSLSPP